MQTNSPLSAGTTLGRYEIRSQIGAGGMGEVFLARDTQLDRTVALKVLPENVASDQLQRSRAGPSRRRCDPAACHGRERLLPFRPRRSESESHSAQVLSPQTAASSFAWGMILSNLPKPRLTNLATACFGFSEGLDFS